MHANRQHFRYFTAFLVQHVKRIAQILKEVVGGVKALRRSKAHVVAIERVRHDQVRHGVAITLGHFNPKRQIIAVVVAVVIEAAVFNHQLTGIGAIAAGVPA